MNFSLTQIAVVLFVPAGLTILASRGSGMTPGKISLAFLLGTLTVWPVVKLANLLDGPSVRRTGHYYLDELIEATLAAAMPEELGKGLAVLAIASLARFPGSPLAWLGIGTAVHSGFAAVEGLLSALGNEGIFKVLIGRSLGALSHGSWGILFAWFVWKGCVQSRRRWLNWAAAILVPVSLHAVINASMADVPGTSSDSDDAMPSGAAILIMFSGIGAFIASLAGAAWAARRARRIQTS